MKTYFLQWALDTISNSNGTFANPIGEIGDYNFKSSSFSRDSFTVTVRADSLRGRKIYMKLWAQNEYGRSEPALDSGYTKLAKLANLSVSKGLIKDSLKISFTQPTNSNISSFTLRLDTSGSDFANPERNFTAMAGTDTVLKVNYLGYYYKVSVSANSPLDGASSDTIWDSGYSRIPAPVVTNGEALNTGFNKITWDKGYIGLNDVINYAIYRKDNSNFVSTVISGYADATSNATASYIDSSSQPGVHYEYYLKAFAISRPESNSVSIESDTSNHVGVDTKIGMVANFVQDTANIKQTSAKLYWTQRGSLVNYEIYYSRLADITTAKMKDVEITGPSFSIEISDSLAIYPGALWHFWIKAKTGGASPNLGTLTPDDNTGILVYTLPEVPVIDSVTEGESADTIFVNWSKSDNWSGIDYIKYQVAYRKSSVITWDTLTSQIDTFAKLSKNDLSLSRGELYIFKVNAFIEKDTDSPEGSTNGKYGKYLESGYSDTKTGYLKYDTIANFRVYNESDSIKDDRINLYWDRVVGSGVSYQLYRSGVNDVSTATLLPNTSLTDVGYYQDVRVNDGATPLPGTAYYYWVTAKKNTLLNSESDKKQLRGTTTSGFNGVDSAWTKFIAPSNLTVSGVFSSSTMTNDKNKSYTDSIVIRWDKMVSVDSFRLVGTLDGVNSLDTSVSDTIVVWKSMERGKVYSFKVCAFNSFVGKDSPKWSEVVTGFAMLEAPTNVTLEQDTANSGVRISFDTVRLAEKYLIYYSKTTNSNFEKFCEVQHANQSRLDTFDNTLSPGQKVWYYVTAYNNVTGGSDSSEVVDTFCPVSPPNGLSATKGTRSGNVYVTWELDRFTRGVDSFRLYRDTLAGSWTENDHIITMKTYSGSIAGTYDVLGAISAGSDTLFSGKKYKYALRSFANGYESKFTDDEKIDTGWASLPNLIKVKGTFADAGASKIKLYLTYSDLIDRNISFIYRRVRMKLGNPDTTYVIASLTNDTLVEDGTDLEEGMAYSYEFKAYNSTYIGLTGENSVWSNQTGASLGSAGMISADWSPLTYGGKKFATPTIHAVRNFDSLKVDTIKISWASDSLATYYYFQADTSTTFSSFVEFGVQNNSLRSLDSYYYAPHDGFAKTQVYYFRMQKLNQEYPERDAWDSLTSPWSEIDSSWSKLIPPTGITATTTIVDTIRVNWNKYSWKDTVSYVVVYKDFNGVWDDSVAGNTDSVKFRSVYSEGEKQIGVYLKHDKFGTSDTSYPLVIGMGKIVPPTFSSSPTRGNYLDSIVMEIDETAVSSAKTKFRLFSSTDKTSLAISSDNSDDGLYYSSDSSRLVYKNISGLSSDEYGAKIYFRVAWSLGSVFSEKSEIDSGWTQLKVPRIFRESALEDPLDSMAIKFTWINPSNADTIIVHKTSIIDNYFAWYKSIVVSDGSGVFIDTIKEEDRRKSYYYKIFAKNELDNSDSKFTDSLRAYVKVYNVTNFSATDGTKRDTVELNWTADLDTFFTIRVFEDLSYSSQVDSAKNLKAFEGLTWKPDDINTYPGQWYYFRINLEGDENRPVVKIASLDSGYALIPEIGRDSVIITNDTSLIRLGTDTSNVGDSAFTQFDATRAFNINYIKKVYISKYNSTLRRFDTIDTLTMAKKICKDEDLTFGEINRYSLKFVNKVSTGFEREYYSFTTLRKPALSEWNSDNLSFTQIKLNISKANNDKTLIDSVVLYRMDSEGNKDTLVYSYDSRKEPNSLIDSFNLTQALFYSYKAAFYNNETGISKVCDSIDSVYAKLQAPVFDNISKGFEKDTIYIRWMSVSDAENGYRLYHNINHPNGSYEFLANLDTRTDTFYKDTFSYEQCKEIYYRLVAVGKDTTSVLSECTPDYGSRAFRGVNNLVSKNVPQLLNVDLEFSVPPNITLENPSPNERYEKGVRLMRYDTITDTFHTEVEYAPDGFKVFNNGGGFYSLKDVDSLLIGQLYFYRVLAKSSASVSTSELSNVAKGYVLPPAITDISASGGNKIDTITLMWTRIDSSILLRDTVDAQILYRSKDGFSNYDSIVLGGTDSIFEDYGTKMNSSVFLQSGHDYSYKIKAMVKISAPDTGNTTFNTTLYSAYSSVVSGWAQMGSLTNAHVNVVQNDTSNINRVCPPTTNTDSIIKIEFSFLPNYAKYLKVYRKDLEVFNLVDSLAISSNSASYADTVMGSRDRGEILQYRIRMGADHEADAYFDTVSYTNLQPIVSMEVLEANTSRIRILVTLADNSCNDADSVRMSRFSLADVCQDSFSTAVEGSKRVTIIDSGGTPGTLYKYRASLYNSATGYCVYGDVVDTVGKTILPPIFDTISKGIYEDSIYIVWNKNEFASRGYILYRDTTGLSGSVDASYDSIKTFSIDDTVYADKKVFPASKFIYYKVLCVGENFRSEKSTKDYGYLKYKGVKDLTVKGWSENMSTDSIQMDWTMPVALSLDTIFISRLINADSSLNLDTLAAHRIAISLSNNRISAPKNPTGDYTNYTYLNDNARSELLLGQLYFYRIQIKIKNVAEASTPSNLGIGYLNLPKVTGVYATQGEGDSIVVSWTKLPNVLDGKVDSYRVYRSDGKMASVSGTLGELTDYCTNSSQFSTLLEKGADYKYAVVAEMDIDQDTLPGDGIGNFEKVLRSPISDSVLGYTFPDSATLVSVSKGTVLDTVVIKYKTPKNADTVKLFRKLRTAPNWPTVALSGLPGNMTTAATYRDTTIEMGALYQYFIMVRKGVAVDSCSVDSGYSLLGPPDSILIANNGKNSDLIRLQVFSPNDQSYQDSIVVHKVSASEGSTDSVTYRVATPFSGNMYLVSDTHKIHQGTFYQYKVRFKNELGTSSYTVAKTTKAYAKLDVPTIAGVGVREYEDTIKVTWSKVNHADEGYVIWIDSTEATEGKVASAYVILDTTSASPSDTLYKDTIDYLPEQRVFYKVQALGYDTTSVLSSAVWGTLKYGGLDSLIIDRDSPKVDTIYFSWSIPTTIKNPEYAFYKYDSIQNIGNLTNAYKMSDVRVYPVVGTDTLFYAMDKPASDKLTVGNLYFYRCVVTVSSVVSDASDTKYGFLAMPNVKNFSASNGGKYVSGISEIVPYTDSIIVSWNKIRYFKNGESPTYILSKYDNSGTKLGHIEITDTSFVDSVGSTRFNVATERGYNYTYGIKAKYTIIENAIGGSVNHIILSKDSVVDVGYTFPDSAGLISASRGTLADTIKIEFVTPKYADSIVLFRTNFGNASTRVDTLQIGATASCLDGSTSLDASSDYVYQIWVYKNLLVNKSNVDTGYIKLATPDSLWWEKRYQYASDFNDTSEILIKWNYCEDAQGYWLYMAKNSLLTTFAPIDSFKLTDKHDTVYPYKPKEFLNRADSIYDYYFRVRAYVTSERTGNMRYSELSMQDTGTIASHSVVGISAACNATKDSIRVSWLGLRTNYDENIVDSYVIYQAANTKKDNGFYRVASTNDGYATSLSIDSSLLAPGNFYYYKMKVYYQDNKRASIYSPVTSENVALPLGKANLRVSQNKSAVTVIFDTIKGVTSYKIYSKTDTLPTTTTVLQSWTNNSATEDSIVWEDEKASEGKIYYYGLVAEKVVNVDGEELTIKSKFGFTPEDRKCGYKKSTFSIVDFDFTAGGIKLFWSRGVNFGSRYPDGYDLSRGVTPEVGSPVDISNNVIEKSVENDVIVTIKDSGTSLFGIKEIGKQYRYLLRGKVISKLQDTMYVVSDSMNMLYDYHWANDSAGLNIDYGASYSGYEDKIIFWFSEFMPLRDTADFDTVGIIPDTLSYYVVARFKEESSGAFVEEDRDTIRVSNKDLTIIQRASGADKYYITDNDKDSIFTTNLNEGERYIYSVKGYIDYGAGTLFESRVIRDSSLDKYIGTLKMRGPTLTGAEYITNDGARYGIKLKWDKETTAGDVYKIGRDTLSSFENEDYNYRPTAVDDVARMGGYIVGDTVFLDSNVTTSPLGKTSMGETYYYRVQKGIKNAAGTDTLFTAWSNMIPFSYGLQGDVYSITTASEFNDLATQISTGKIRGSIKVELHKDLNFSGVDSLVPMGTFGHPFRGTFDGQGHTITISALSLSAPYLGVFGSSDAAIIKDLRIIYNTSVITSAKYFGGMVAEVAGNTSISNISVTFNDSISGADYVGGFIGGGGGLAILSKDSVHISKNVSGKFYIGGFAGQLSANSSVDSCQTIASSSSIIYTEEVGGGFVGSMWGKITNSKMDLAGGVKLRGASTADVRLGGFVGIDIRGSSYENITIANIPTVEAVSSTVSTATVGGFIGYSSATKISDISLCKVRSIKGVANGNVHVGGFVGLFDNVSGYMGKFNVQGCDSLVGISTSGNACVGIIAGRTSEINSTLSIGSTSDSICVSLADGKYLSATSSSGSVHIGGAVGYAKSITLQNVKIDSVQFRGSAPTGYVGGAVGYESSGGSKYNEVAVKSKVIFNSGLSSMNHLFVGGLVGYAKSSTTSSSSVVANFDLTDADFASKKVYMGGVYGHNVSASQDLVSIDKLSLDNFAFKVGDSSAVGGYAGYLSVKTFTLNPSSISQIEFTSTAPNTAGDSSFVGGIAGRCVSTNKINIDYTGAIKLVVAGGDGSAVGGMFGSISVPVGATLIDTSSEGIIINTGSSTAGTGACYGGLVGHVSSGSISGSKVRATIEGGKIVGGLVGKLSGDADLSTSYADSLVTIKGGTFVGGLVGEIATDDNSNGISKCYVFDINTSGNLGVAGLLVGKLTKGLISYSYAVLNKIDRTDVAGTSALFVGRMDGGRIGNSYAIQNEVKISTAGSYSDIIKKIGAYNAGDTSGAITSENRILMSEDITGSENYELRNLFSYPILVNNVREVDTSIMSNSLRMSKNNGYYVITKPIQLDAIGDVRLVGKDYTKVNNTEFPEGLRLADSFVVGNLLDFSSYVGYTPVGYALNDLPFTGVLSGGATGQTIRGLDISYDNRGEKVGTDYRGLVGYLADGKIQNLRLTKPVSTANAGSMSAVVCGKLVSGLIDQVQVDSANINIANGQKIALICGEMTGGTIQNVNTINSLVKGTRTVGAIVGEMTGGTLTKAVSSADTVINDVGNASGIVALQSGGTIKGVYSAARVLGGTNIYKVSSLGGGSVDSAYSLAETNLVKGIDTTWVIGLGLKTANGRNLFLNVTKSNDILANVGLSSSKWVSSATPTTIPALKLFNSNPFALEECEILGALGSPKSTMDIASPVDLAFVSSYSSVSSVSTFKVVAPITFTSTDDFYEGDGNFEPIATLSGKTFDGQGYVIKNIKINVATGKSGLISELSGNAVVKNLGLIGCEVIDTTANGTVGMLVGNTNSGSISDIYLADCRVVATGAGSSIGGVVGKSNDPSDRFYRIIALNTVIRGNETESKVGGIVGSGTGVGRLEDMVAFNDTIIGKTKDRISAGGVLIEGAYAWVLDSSATGDASKTGSAGKSIDFPSILDSSIYTDLISNSNNAWIWPANIEDWQCAPRLRYMSIEDASPKVLRFANENGGTKEKPHEIANLQQLNLVRSFAGSGLYYRLEANVDCNAVDFDANSSNGNWIPIGRDGSFMGHFDGNGYSVSNMKVIGPSGGLFANLGKASGDDVEVENLCIYNAEISNCETAGILSPHNYGKVYYVLVKDSRISATGEAYVGSILGQNEGKINSCLTAGNRLIGKTTGGIVGKNLASATLQDCGSVADSIRGTTAGRVVGKNIGTITNLSAYRSTLVNDAVIPQESTDAGNIHGKSISLLAYNSYHFERELSMYTLEYFSWPNVSNQNNVFVPVGSHVTLDVDSGYVDFGIPNPKTFAGGDGTRSMPYRVMTVEDLNNIKYGTEMYFRLDTNIVDVNQEIDPIGTDIIPFEGGFDGNYHYISGIKNNVTANGISGLFGKIKASQSSKAIKNLAIINSTITGGSYNNIGAFAGADDSPSRYAYTYKNLLSYNNTVITTGDTVGGIIGNAPEATFTNCLTVSGNLEAKNYLGGITAKAADMVNCGVIMDSIKITETNGTINRLASASSSFSSNSGIGWYFSKVTKGGSVVNPTSISTETGNNAILPDFLDSTYWQNRGFTRANGWIASTTGKFQIAPMLQYMDYDTLVTAGLQPTSGSGTEADPYKITTGKQLNLLHFFVKNSPLSSKYVEVALSPTDSNVVDLREFSTDWKRDLNGDYAGNWTPISNFDGYLNFNKGGVAGLEVRQVYDNNQGFFASVVGGYIKGMGVYESAFSGASSSTDYVGALIGHLSGGHVEGVIARKDSISSGSSMGGLVGRITGGSISQGISVRNIFVSGSVIGGAVGSYTGGDLSCIAAMSNRIFSRKSPFVNAILGSNSVPVDVMNDTLICDSSLTRIGSGHGVIPTVSEGKLYYMVNYIGNNNLWESNGFYSTDYFRNLTDGTTEGDYRNIYTLKNVPLSVDDGIMGTLRGSGTIDDPHLISDIRTLMQVGFADYVSRALYFEQIADIDMSNTDNFWPIGMMNSNNPDNKIMDGFSGVYNGNGYRIVGLHVADTTVNYAGLFAKTVGDADTIKNVVLDSAILKSAKYVGGIVARLAEQGKGVVKDCRVFSSTLKQIATATEAGAVGGIVGYSQGTDRVTKTSTVSRCMSLNNTMIANSNYTTSLGGIVGLSTDYAIITYNAVVGGLFIDEIDGLTGRILGSGSSTINNNYSWEGVMVRD